MGVFSDWEVTEQNPPYATGGRIEGTRPDGAIIPLEPGCPPYVINARKAERHERILAVINRPRPMWHEGEGCSANSCCCDSQGA
ncbi:UNVERIFIED_ORG: hypothetical protein M2328_005775 [Rhodococcus erythropolis]